MITEWARWGKHWDQQAAQEAEAGDHVNAARHRQYARVARAVIDTAKERTSNEHRS